MLEHIFRAGHRGPRRWNKAADYVVNQLLVDEGIGKINEKWLYDPKSTLLAVPAKAYTTSCLKKTKTLVSMA